MYAIIKTGGKQYKVAEGDVLRVELLDVAEGDVIEIPEVLAVCDGESLKVGSPVVEGAVVKASVVEHGKGKKVIVYHFKAKKNVRKKNGHRQPFTKLKIESISL